MSEDIPTNRKRMAIILHSGAYDRACYALCLAQAALASGMEVHMLLTFEGLRRFTKDHLAEIGEETPATVRPYVVQGLDTGAIVPLEEQVAEAKKMGLRIYACPNAMASLSIALRDLQGIDEVMGLVAFLSLASTADVNWYI